MRGAKDVISGVRLEEGKYGLRAIVATAWSDRIRAFLLARSIAELELNDGDGWRGQNITFLREFPRLRSFKILDFKISSVEPIHLLHELRTLEVMTHCRTEIRFSEFPRLADCGLEWRPNATSLFDCKTLRHLFLNRYSEKTTAPFARLTNLVSLAILNSPIADLHGLHSLTKLRCLRLANVPRLTSLAGIEGVLNLEELEIHTCRNVRSIDEVGYLGRLRKLHLNNNGDIASFKPLAKLRRLESVNFYESTNVADGDLSPLLKQKNLKDVSFQNRRHYSHRREEIGSAFGG